MPLHIRHGHSLAPQAQSLEPLPLEGADTIAAITALMLRRTRIKQARDTAAPAAAEPLQAAPGYHDGEGDAAQAPRID